MNALLLLEKYFPAQDTLAIIHEHSRLVANKALTVVDRLDRDDIDRQFVEEAALLHDIGACRTNLPQIGCSGTEPYIRHGIIGRDILEAEGLPRHALVCERHIGVGLTPHDIRKQNLPLPEREMAPVSLEERIICFADLFYSKNPRKIDREKTIDEVRNGLRKFGDEKVRQFDGWVGEFAGGN